MPMNQRTLRPRRKAASVIGSDPYWSQVSLLLHMDGTNASNVFTDSSLGARSITPFGNAQISTANKKFGSGAAAFDGNNDYLETSPIGFGASQDFTVEAFINFSSVASYEPVVMQTNGWVFYAFQNVLYWGVPLVSNDLQYTWNQTTGVWYHIAASRSNGTLRLFVDGAEVASQASTKAYDGGSNICSIARYVGVGQMLEGSIDELRITTGVGRYTSNFTPPTAAFPNG